MPSSRSGAKLFVSFAALAAAVLLARPFRHEHARKVRLAPQGIEHVVLRETAAPGDGEVLRTEAPTAEIQPTLLAPPADSGNGQHSGHDVERLAPPPAMARAYPGSAPQEHGKVEKPFNFSISTGQRIKQRTHTVRDGDTLEILAQRYLGDRARWREVYEANRDQIDQPDLLPLGARLVIPPRNEPRRISPPDQSSDKSVAQAPLVPLSP